MKIGRTYVSNLLNLVFARGVPVVGTEEKNLEACHTRLPENAFGNNRTAKNVP